MTERANKQSGVIEPGQEKLAETKKVFESREEVEQKGLFYKGRIVKFHDSAYQGKAEIFVPKWNMDTAYELGRSITWIIATLFPHDWFFLATLDTTKVATAAARVYKILYEDIYPQVMEIIQKTLRTSKHPDVTYHIPMDDEEFSVFRRSMSPVDIVELFVAIVEQEINNEVMQALSKKLQRLLGEKFQLENAFPNISELMGEASQSLLERIRLSNLPSSTSTPQ